MTDSRVKKSTYNMIAGFLNQFLTLIFSFISRTVFIAVLGKEYLGLNGIFADVLNLLSMADLGMNTAMAYSFYRPLAEHDEKRLAALVHFYRKIYNVIAIVVTVAGIAVIPFLRLIVNTEKEIPYLEVYYLFALAGIVISYLFVYKTTILTADQKNYVVTQITIWTNLIKTIFQIVVLVLTHNYILYLAIHMIFQFINNLAASRRAVRSYPYINNWVELSREEQRGIFENIKSVFVYKISGTLFNATTNIMISVIVGTVAVGIYSNYQMVSQKLLLIIQIVFSALTASIGNVVVKENAEKRYEVFAAAQSVSFILCGIITSIFGLLANDLIKVWLGEDFLLPVHTLLALTLNTYLSCVLLPLWVYRDATGLYKETKYIMLIGAAAYIILAIVGGNLWGITGIILSSAIARLSTYFWYEPKLLFREYFDRSAGKYYVSLLNNFLLVTVTIFGINYFVKDIFVNSWGSLMVKGMIVAAACTVIFMGAYVKSAGFRMIRCNIKKSVFMRRRQRADTMSEAVVQRNTSGPVVWLLGTEDYGNLGDHEIAVAERHFFETYFSDFQLIEISARNYWTHRHEMLSQIGADDIIVGTGGGNLGNQYPESERIRNDLIKSFPNQNIVIMPQTIWFTKDNDGRQKLQYAAESYGKHNKLILAVREKYSFAFAKEHFLTKTVLVPDIVLFDYEAVRARISEEKREITGMALLCLRSDLEGNMDKAKQRKLVHSVKKKCKYVKRVDTQKDYLISTERREAELDEFFRELASADIVITDRLHGMVFAALTEIPCIVFDNYNKKVSGIYEWIRELSYIRFKDSVSGIEQDIEELKAMKGQCRFQITGLEERFAEFASIIRGVS